MKKNIGIIDRWVRIVIALIITSLYLTNIISGTLGIVLMVFAIVFLFTSLIRFCPLYLPFKINTWNKK